MRVIKLSVLALTCSLLTGCINIEGVHTLHRYGETDSGAYRLSMSRVTYALMTSDRTHSDMVQRLQRFSRPTTRFDAERAYLEDTSAGAAMEHMYDDYRCTLSVVAGYVDCHFSFSLDAGATPGWSLDWTVVLQADMKLISSNHHRTRRADGRDHLIGYFDGNRVSSATVDFTVRVPRA